MPIQIQRLKTPDENARAYTSRTRLTMEPHEEAWKGQMVENGVVEALLEIDGVAMVGVFAYHAIVFKAPSFTWEEIEPHILKLFAALNIDLATSRVSEPEARP